MFRARLVYDKDDLMALSRATRWPRGGGRRHSILRKIGLGVGVLLTAMAAAAGLRACAYEISSAFSGGGYRADTLASVGIVFYAAIGLSLVLQNSEWIWKKAAWKSYKEKGSELDFRFSEDGFTVTVPTCSSEFSYQGIAKLYEDADYFVLILPAGTGYVLRKSSFIEGDPAAFGPWLAEKTGKNIIQI